MRFDPQQHRFYGGIDRHARRRHVGLLDQAGNVVFDRHLPARPEALRRAGAPFRDDLIVGVECMFAWYWVADLCRHRSRRSDCNDESGEKIFDKETPYLDFRGYLAGRLGLSSIRLPTPFVSVFVRVKRQQRTKGREPSGDSFRPLVEGRNTGFTARSAYAFAVAS
jgi:hypothetical protein